MAVGIQLFTLIFLLVYKEDLGEVIRFLHVVIDLLLGVGKFGTELLNGFLENCYFLAWRS